MIGLLGDHEIALLWVIIIATVIRYVTEYVKVISNFKKLCHFLDYNCSRGLSKLHGIPGSDF